MAGPSGLTTEAFIDKVLASIHRDIRCFDRLPGDWFDMRLPYYHDPILPLTYLLIVTVSLPYYYCTTLPLPHNKIGCVAIGSICGSGRGANRARRSRHP